MAFSFRIGTKWCHDFPKLAKESGFYFNMHRSRIRIDWNRISNIDIDKIIREKDFYSIDDNINSVIDYCFESEYDVKILDPNFVKLFRLAQLAVEYLLYCKQYLDHSVVILKDELKSKIEENVKLKKEVITLEEVVKHMKEKAKERNKVVETKVGDCNGEIYKCPHCPKTFISLIFLSAHIVRRHAYGSDLYIPSSPIHEHYRNETERLHNEIKNLKERLNNTERVIRNESENNTERKTLDYDRRQAKTEIHSFKCENNLEEHSEYKGYQEEIKNLKTMLLDELHNVRQKEKSIYERTTETNVQTLINQQEKEFQKLKNQLLEKLTPDIESMQEKLQSQENYWKSQIEHLENQHFKDVERLTTELKLTQNAAKNMKTEYELKVNELQRQTANQSSILIEQSKQLQSLSQEINISQLNEKNKGAEIIRPIETNEILQRSDESNLIQNDCTNTEIQQNIIGNNTPMLSSAFSSTVYPLLSENSFPDSMHSSNYSNKSIVSENKRNTKQKGTKSAKNKKLGSIKQLKGDINNYSSVNDSESGELRPDKENHSKIRHIKYKQPIMKTNLKTSSISSLEGNLNKNTFNEFLSNVKHDKQSETMEDYFSSATNCESSISESSSESVTVAQNNFPLCEYEIQSLASSNIKQITENNSFHKIRASLKEAFEQKLKDLGIDPEWQGIPKATFKQKMDIIKHHHKLTAKKAPKYHNIKLKIIEELLAKISRKRKDMETSKSVRTSSSCRVITNTQPTTVKILSDQEDSGNQISTLHSMAQSKFHSTPETNHSNESVIHCESPIKSLESVNYNTIGRLLDFTPDVTNPSKTVHCAVNSQEISARRPLLNQMKPLYRDLFSKKSIENDIVDNLYEQQELQHTVTSPKQNRSVLKSTSGSLSSITKKKVIFDLSNQEAKESLPDNNMEEEELNGSNWNSSSTYSDKRNLSEPEQYKIPNNIVLKTAQSDKIAEISRKLEAQLSMVRQKPIGSVETIFSSKYIQMKENQHKSEVEKNSSSLSSLTEIRIPSSTLNYKKTNHLLPQPAPRNMNDKISDTLHVESISEISDLDSDIDKILKLE